jgi:hypothetical protein
VFVMDDLAQQQPSEACMRGTPGAVDKTGAGASHPTIEEPDSARGTAVGAVPRCFPSVAARFQGDVRRLRHGTLGFLCGHGNHVRRFARRPPETQPHLLEVLARAEPCRFQRQPGRARHSGFQRTRRRPTRVGTGTAHRSLRPAYTSDSPLLRKRAQRERGRDGRRSSRSRARASGR